MAGSQRGAPARGALALAPKTVRGTIFLGQVSQLAEVKEENDFVPITPARAGTLMNHPAVSDRAKRRILNLNSYIYQ